MYEEYVIKENGRVILMGNSDVICRIDWTREDIAKV